MCINIITSGYGKVVFGCYVTAGTNKRSKLIVHTEFDIITCQDCQVVLAVECLIGSEDNIIVLSLNLNTGSFDDCVIVQEYIIFSGHIIPKKSCAIARSQ